MTALLSWVNPCWTTQLYEIWQITPEHPREERTWFLCGHLWLVYNAVSSRHIFTDGCIFPLVSEGRKLLIWNQADLCFQGTEI